MQSTYNKIIESGKLVIARPFMHVHPHIITITALYFSFLFFFFLTNHLYFPALLAFIATALDMVDGTVSRIQKKESRFGFFLDSTFDRISDFLLISAFGFAGFVPWEIVVPLLGLSFLISFIKSRVELALYGKVLLHAGIIERPQRWFLLLACTISVLVAPCQSFYEYSLVEILFIVLILLSIITVIQRFYKGYHLLKE